MKHLALILLAALTGSAYAQLTGVSIEPVITHDASIDPSLDGYTTYRVYADVTASTDFVSAVFGDVANPLVLGCTGTIYHSTGVNFNYATEVNPLFFPTFPAAEYDSWFTIGAEDANGGVNVQNTADTMEPALALFNAGEGFTINDPIGASWFNVFPCVAGESLEDCAAGSLAFGGDDNSVLLAQITATGDVYGILNLQVFPAGIQADQQQATGQTFSTNEADVFGCTNPDATNYDMTATLDDLSCILPCTVALSVENITSPSCNGENDALIQVVATGAQGADYFYLDAIEGTAQNFGNFSSLLSGDYTVYVEDAAGCLDSLDVEVPVTEEVEVLIDAVTPPSCDQLEDASITILGATGGSGMYEYYISNNPSFTTQTEWTGLAGGQILSIYAIDSNGCFGQSEPITIPAGPSCIGCTIPVACNYNPSALEDDGSCIFFCPGCIDPTACNFDDGALQDDGSCFYPESEEFCDCNGNQLDALGVCGGTCLGDADGDGICDNVDDCVGEYDECGVCNGSGEVYECGCSDIPDGDCDCDGNQLDAIAVCGGDCAADADADGICDDVDDCVGEYDECGVCNGGGFPPGACNCAGDLFDDCGVCGGDNSSCIGCTYELACNYDPAATILDASLCEFGNCPGCTVIGACNYNPTVSEDDGSCEWCSCLESGDVGGSWQGEGAYTLTVEGFPAVQEGLTTYRFYVNMEASNDRVSAVYGNDEAGMFINTPDGAYNSIFNSSWNASGINPAFLGTFPELADDTYATIGLTGPASTSGVEDAADPSISEDSAQPITPYFLTPGATALESTLLGSAWYILNTAGNGLPDENMRVLILQVTTAGGVSGTLNYQVFPLGLGENNTLVSNSFNVMPQEDVEGCTDVEAANYCPEAQVDDGSCLENYVGCLDAEACNYAANATTDSGAECTYPDEGSCDCDGNQLDALGVCGGDCEWDADNDGVCDDVDPCVGELDACGVCNGPGGIYDCGCSAIPEGACDCDGNVLDALGVCGGECESDANGNGVCDADEVGGPEACGWGTVWNVDSGACVLAVPPFLGEFGDYNTLNPCYYDLDLSGSVGAGDLINFLSTYNLATGCSWTDE